MKPMDDSLEGRAWDIATRSLRKIERPTSQEIEDRIRDGYPAPAWVLKDTLPTHALAYFASTEDLYLHLVRTYGETDASVD